MAQRTEHGYRQYTEHHARALRAFRELARACGHGHARQIMRSFNDGDLDGGFQLLDEAHERLLGERRTVIGLESVVRGGASRRPTRQGRTHVGALARRLGVDPATLRMWEREGFVTPEREPNTGYRTYSEREAQEAYIVQQLRRGRYPVAEIHAFLSQYRRAGGTDSLRVTIAEWRERLRSRSMAMLRAAAMLDDFLGAGEARRF